MSTKSSTGHTASTRLTKFNLYYTLRNYCFKILGKFQERCSYMFQLKYRPLKHVTLNPVLWIRIGFNAKLDPTFYLDANQYPDPESQTNANACGSRS
jgi:hypothetical protein